MSFTQWDKAAASVDTGNQAAGYQSVFNLYLLPPTDDYRRIRTSCYQQESGS